MNIYIALAVVSALYAGAIAVVAWVAPKGRQSTGSRLRSIDTSTQAGRRRFIRTAAQLAKEARESLKDGIE